MSFNLKIFKGCTPAQLRGALDYQQHMVYHDDEVEGVRTGVGAPIHDPTMLACEFNEFKEAEDPVVAISEKLATVVEVNGGEQQP